MENPFTQKNSFIYIDETVRPTDRITESLEGIKKGGLRPREESLLFGQLQAARPKLQESINSKKATRR